MTQTLLRTPTMACEKCGSEMPMVRADVPQHCENCRHYLRRPLTDDGVDFVIFHLHEYIETGVGRTQVLDEWAEHVSSYPLAGEDLNTLTQYKIIRAQESE